MEITNHGQIEKITIPAGWVEGPPTEFQGIGTRSLREFHPPDAPNAQLCLFYRGLPVSADAGDAFRSILAEPDHQLTPEEIESLREILRERADSKVFDLVNPPRTALVGDKRVLMLEGVYKGTNKYLQEIFLNADGSGRVVQEIYFIAPQDDYCLHAVAAQEACNSIQWKVAVETW